MNRGRACRRERSTALVITSEGPFQELLLHRHTAKAQLGVQAGVRANEVETTDIRESYVIS